MLIFRSNSPSGRNSPKTGRNGAPSSPRREHEITAQEVGIIQQQQKCHAICEFHSKHKREKPPSTIKQQTRAPCTNFCACLIPASCWESISSVQFSSWKGKSDEGCPKCLSLAKVRYIEHQHSASRRREGIKYNGPLMPRLYPYPVPA
jgi:hypothetical protein